MESHFPLQLGTRKGVRVTTGGKEGPESSRGGDGELGEPGKQCSATERLTESNFSVLPCPGVGRTLSYSHVAESPGSHVTICILTPGSPWP